MGVLEECSPRERGWTPADVDVVDVPRVFPARAGMDPLRNLALPACARVPRASGDGPYTVEVTAENELCSPRERGWTYCH